jgi:hypothetical protein
MWYNLEASAVAQGQYGGDAAAAAAAGASLNEKGSAPDHYALHAGCPPSKGEKWAANKWVLNMPDKQASAEARARSRTRAPRLTLAAPRST